MSTSILYDRTRFDERMYIRHCARLIRTLFAYVNAKMTKMLGIVKVHPNSI